MHDLVRLHEHDRVVAEFTLQSLGLIREVRQIGVGGLERGPSPGRREHDQSTVCERHPHASGEFGPYEARFGIRHALPIDAGIALLDDGTPIDVAQLVRAFVHDLGHEGVRREEVVGGEQVAESVGGLDRAAGHIEPHEFQRRAVPRVEVDLSAPLAERGWEGRVVHEVAGGGEGAPIGGTTAPHDPHVANSSELAAQSGDGVRFAQRPHVLKVREIGIGEEGSEDRLRVAQRTVSRERLVENGAGLDRAQARERDLLGGENTARASERCAGGCGQTDGHDGGRLSLRTVRARLRRRDGSRERRRRGARGARPDGF